ncbi:MAG: CHAT domain-containing protein [Rhodoferax sp.]|nr:CHAT domain-containing protein [Rhodoferax sp.]
MSRILMPLLPLFRWLLTLLWLLLGTTAFASASVTDWDAQIAQGIAYREQGQVQQAIQLLGAARQHAESDAHRARAAGELGITLLQTRQSTQNTQAQQALQQAYAFFSGAARADYAIYLGHLAKMQKQTSVASGYYQEALTLADTDIEVRLSADLGLVRLLPKEQRLVQLQALSQDIQNLEQTATSPNLARYHLHLGHLAQQLGSPGLPLAYRHLEQARALSAESQQQRLQIEALDALAQLYEDQGRTQEALMLTRQALTNADQQDNASVAELLISLQWRLGRLLKLQGKEAPALAAYQRAVEQIEAVRQDIPVEYEDGRSSFRATLEPIYLGYADLMLRQITRQGGSSNNAVQLRAVKEAIELIRQTEMQDFLGDRCAVEIVQGGSDGHIATGTAILYPLILPDRLELLLETSTGILHRSSPVSQTLLEASARIFATLTRDGESSGYDAPARQLYDWLLKPFDAVLAEQHIQSLVVVPDGVLRLVPIAALHDGQRYAIEKYAVSMVTALSMTNNAVAANRNMGALVAGVSEPGPVVEKISPALAAQILQLRAEPSATQRALKPQRALRSVDAATRIVQSGTDTLRRLDDLRHLLQLPGVKEEIKVLNGILQGTSLLNAQFTVDQFRNKTESGTYQIVHIASHGVFGGSAENSFIMAFDDVIDMNGLQTVLRAEKFQNHPIELLTLSACETAEGNDRAPLGISGAAIKARAKSVLGTLWPVDDEAARTLMENFYTNISSGKQGKAQALRQAQLSLLRNTPLVHPFYWAPFVLIGNWL